VADAPVIAYVPDLMDRSRVASAAPRTRFVSRPSDLAAAAPGARLVVVDLSRPGVLEAVPEVARLAPVLGFGSHVDTAVLEAATRAGAQALPRSRFFARLGELLAGA
jgi:hypothetical protein